MQLTTVIVTHDPRIVQQVDRVVAIRDGKTSTETIRQVSQLERAMVGAGPDQAEGAGQEVTFHEYVVLDSAGRLQVPQEFLEEFGIGDRAQLEASEEGILIRPIAGHQGSGSGKGGLAEQVADLFADEKPPDDDQGWLARFLKRG
jgi:hypothetical protein